MDKAIKDWSDFCLSIINDNPKYTHSIRKLVPNSSFETTLDSSIKLTNVGFKAGGSKLTMLKKYYTNPESMEEAKHALKRLQAKGDIGSVAFSTIGDKKKFTHHQHCIQSIAIRHEPDGKLSYTVFYRAAEIIKIFTGDMVFLRDIIMPQFGMGKVMFFFSNANINAMYCPIMFIHCKKDWIEALPVIFKRDPPFFRRFKKWTEMYFSTTPINYSSAEVIRKLIHDNLGSSERKAILDEFRKIEKRHGNCP